MVLEIAQYFSVLFKHFHWFDAVDILMASLVIYRVLLLVRRSGAAQMLSGIALLLSAFLLSESAGLLTLHWILESFFSNFILIAVVLFQSELRMALAQLGQFSLFGLQKDSRYTQLIDETVRAAFTLAEKRFGALIVFEGKMSMGYHSDQGVALQANLTADLLQALFHPTSPLHDGAVIVRGSQVASAGCFLPMSKNPNVDKNYGARHRAALGLTEESDALVIVISEESQSVSVVSQGNLISEVDKPELRSRLYDFLQLRSQSARPKPIEESSVS